ncbi:MAG: di-trans,poly-cis-decaprenylcistransferase [Firmicutes bacterium]|nr:di-trans,poly-cis-decaprenylcistransferase [Bacillota bacterium]
MSKVENSLPKHIAIIVDGNRRWATNNGFDKKTGHKMGFDNLEKIIRYATEKNIAYLSLYVFSTENFKRDSDEVDYLMRIFTHDFRRQASRLNEKNIKIIFSGKRNNLSEKLNYSIRFMENLTKENTKTVVNFCLNYGGRSEIADACKNISLDVLRNIISIDEINEDIIDKYMYNHLPPIDLMIRTSGEQRISNFMLWQLAYSELYFTDKCFPDFSTNDFDIALKDFNLRDRRFGCNSQGNKSIEI